LSTNQLAPTEFSSTPFLRQAFASASKAFSVIDAPTQGVVVPYERTGRELIGQLTSAFEVDKRFELLRQAQRYSVNVFPNVLKKLKDQDAVHEVQEGSGVLFIDERFLQ